MAIASNPTRLESKILNSPRGVALAILDRAEGERNLRRTADKYQLTLFYISKVFNIYWCLMWIAESLRQVHFRRPRKEGRKEVRRKERNKNKQTNKQTNIMRTSNAVFHCFTVHFNSLYIMVQLMHLFVLKY
jgi:hypothetical protein